MTTTGDKTQTTSRRQDTDHQQETRHTPPQGEPRHVSASQVDKTQTTTGRQDMGPPQGETSTQTTTGSDGQTTTGDRDHHQETRPPRRCYRPPRTGDKERHSQGDADTDHQAGRGKTQITGRMQDRPPQGDKDRPPHREDIQPQEMDMDRHQAGGKTQHSPQETRHRPPQAGRQTWGGRPSPQGDTHMQIVTDHHRRCYYRLQGDTWDHHKMDRPITETRMTDQGTDNHGDKTRTPPQGKQDTDHRRARHSQETDHHREIQTTMPGDTDHHRGRQECWDPTSREDGRPQGSQDTDHHRRHRPPHREMLTWDHHARRQDTDHREARPPQGDM
ncbi:serine/threonine-protein kinase BUR1-like [Homarus americanus]|uniref:serine/threonine-protein kinase BUR1-like n=1 Tax=Homarus americanus TaxID=6706 RepID=UPI001C462CC9|nr:serine/threonine-protein kinase BUR1-like [Homarus americanus]